MPRVYDITDYATLLDALHCGALLVDRSGRVLHANAAITELLGEPRDSLDGRTFAQIGADARSRSDRETVPAGAASQTDSPGPGRTERVARQADGVGLESLLCDFDAAQEVVRVLTRRDGTPVPVIVSARPLTGTAPLPDHRLITVVDLTAQKAAEQRYAEQYRNMARLSDTVLEQALELKRLNAVLEERVRLRTAELREANFESIYMLALAGEAKDVDTGAHLRRIEQYSAAIAARLGFSPEEVERIGYSSILHDVGKLLVPDEILKKPGPLSEEERRTMELHTIVGEKILSPKPFFDCARQIARSHHENWDGSGYPDRLAGEAIPPAARIVRVTDVFDALTSPRVYKDPWPPEAAAREIEQHSGQSFEPRIVAAFRELFCDGTLTRIAMQLADSARS